MKSYGISSDSSSDDEALIVYSKKYKKIENTEDCNAYTSLLEQDWQPCEFCEEVFANRYTLIRHNINHIIIPLIKQTSYQCNECLHHFLSIEDLNLHISKHHKTLIGNKEKILQSIITNQVVVKCQDDLKEVLNKHNKYKKQVDSSNHDARTSYDEDIIHITNNSQTSKSDFYTVENEPFCYVKNVESLGDASRSNIKCVPSNLRTINDDIDFKNEVKDEPISPTKFERSSSPTDEEKEPIKHRLLFEEDVEDTLFKDLSAECQVNIETLCKEVTLDFDDVFFEDDGIDDTSNLDSYDATENWENRLKNSENGKLGNVSNINGIGSGTNVFENGIKSFENAAVYNGNNKLGSTNIFQNKNNNLVQTKEFESRIKKLENGTDTFTDGISSFGNGTKSFSNFGMESLNSKDRIENDFNLNACTIQTIDLEYYGQAIHYDTLVVPDTCKCRICKKEFPNRFLQIKHETKHLRARKPHMRSPLCCYCDKYIAGNYHNLRNHIKNVHPEKADTEVQFKKNNCPKCKLQYYNFIKHLKNYHEPYHCDKCDRGFETLQMKNEHECGKPKVNLNFAFGQVQRNNDEGKTSIMQLCDLCFSFMKIYMQNRQNYEEVGVKNQFGVRQMCDKCNNLFFTVKLVKRKALTRPPDESKKTLDIKSKVKPLSNKERLLKIQNRLKMMKKINK